MMSGDDRLNGVTLVATSMQGLPQQRQIFRYAKCPITTAVQRSVDIYLSQIMAPISNSMAAKELAVFS